jgi:hypothetical protein
MQAKIMADIANRSFQNVAQFKYFGITVTKKFDS